MSTVSNNNVAESPLDVLQDTLQFELMPTLNVDGPAGFENVTCSVKTVYNTSPPYSGTINFIQGTNGDDDIQGTNEADQIWGLDGDDYIHGRAGDDWIYGGNGDDALYGGYGDDAIFGELGNDFLYGGKGDDGLHGQQGDDEIYGERGDDIAFGGKGDDFLAGDKGNDTLFGGSGDDELVGGKGDDFLSGSDGATGTWMEYDTLTGGAGKDTFVLGDRDTGIYYPYFGHAVITDWDPDQDWVQVVGDASHYSLEYVNSVGSSATDTLLIHHDASSLASNPIAIFQDTTAVDIAADFNFV